VIRFQGLYYNGKNNQSEPIDIECRHQNLTFTVNGNSFHFPLDKVKIPTRVGSTPRFIELPDGAMIESQQHQEIDQILTQFQKKDQLAHVLESKWSLAVILAIIFVITLFYSVKDGIPALAKIASKEIPYSWMKSMSQETLTQLDKKIFKASKLDLQIKQKVQADFQTLQEQFSDLPLKLQFRDGGIIGANAFALPDGNIIITDQLVKIMDHHHQTLSILSHEIGHIYHKHSVRSLLQNSAIALIVFVFTGDIQTFSSLAVAAPTALINLKYSRDFEREADVWARTYLKSQNIPLTRFSEALTKLKESKPRRNKKIKIKDDDSYIELDFLSTHPDIDERIKEK